ncbi:MAG: twin-arginine translocation signal domain-containing protein, partial [Bradyrhizobium sp.]
MSAELFRSSRRAFLKGAAAAGVALAGGAHVAFAQGKPFVPYSNKSLD